MIGILLGRPGSGKTVVVTLLSKWLYGFYTDQFSAKAWISHTTSVDTQEELEAIDMLPKIKGKQFQTPELATLFGLREDDLRIALSNITRIADGHGFASDSGVYGHRSYGDTMFTWLGAVVDIPSIVYKLLHDLGPRFYFNRMPFTDITTQDLFSYLTDKEKFNAKYKAIQVALFDYLKWFEIGPTLSYGAPDSPHLVKMKWDDEKDNSDAMQCISNLTMLLAYLRREGTAQPKNKDIDDEDEKSYSYFAKSIEDVTKAGTVLTNLARGHALITGRNYITMDDVQVVLTTVLSTARIQRVKALIAILDDCGDTTVVRLSHQLNISHSNATRLAVELKAIELADTKLTNEVEYTKSNHPSMKTVISLNRDKFDWFLTEEFRKLRGDFTPVDNRKYIDQPDPEKQAAQEAAKEATTTMKDIAASKEIDMRDIIAENEENIIRMGRSDKWACKCCSVTADRHFMRIHRCSKSKVSSKAEAKSKSKKRVRSDSSSKKN